MTVPQEIELKLDLTPESLVRLRKRWSKRFTPDEVAREKLVSVYFDSKRLSLKRKGLSLRVRAQGDRRIQTLKGGTERGGVFERTEWNTEVDGDEPDLSGVDASPFRKALSSKQIHSEIRPVFRTEVDRTAWLVRTGAAIIEVAFDEGRVIAAEKTRDFSELELELKEGARAELFTLARSLVEADDLRVGVLAKSERGYALLSDADSASFRAEALLFAPELSTEEAFRAIVRSCIRHFRLNEPLLIETRAAEPLHQCRVALRRLRSALSLFKAVTADDQLKDLRARLSFVSQRLGEARDLDVFLQRLLAAGEDEAGTREKQAELIGQVQERRDGAYDRVMRSLQRKPSRALLFDVLAWTETGLWTASTDSATRARRERPISEFAVEALDRQTRKIRRKGRHLEDLDVAALHEVRIQAKKLRYAAEFFSSLADNKRRRKRHRALSLAMTTLQEKLGELNDMATGAKLAKHSAAATPAALGNAPAKTRSPHEIGLEDHDEQAQQALRAAAQAIRDIRDVKPFWAS